MAQINLEEGKTISVTVNRGPLNGGTPVGTANSVQYNNGGTFGGISSVTTDGSNLILASSALKLAGGSNGQVLSTDGSGELTWVTQSSGNGVPSGGDFQIQFANVGAFASDSDFKFIPGNNTLQVPTQTSNLITSNNIVTGNLTATVANLGSVGNVKITGGTSGQYLQTDGNGVLSFANVTQSNIAIAGSNTQVQFNNGGVLGADAQFTYNTGSDTLSVVNLSATNLSGNGSAITNLSASQITGTLPLANYSAWSGNADFSNTAGDSNYANFAGTVVTPIQTNITQLGTLTELHVQGQANLSDLSNVKIYGGSNGGVPMSDGNGNLHWFYNPGLGTVTRVGGDGNVLGITLTGEVTESGNLSLTGPNAATFRTNIGVGTVSVIDLNGNADQFLNGNGVFTAPPDTSPHGNTGAVQYNDGGVFNGVDSFIYEFANNLVKIEKVAVSNLFNSTDAANVTLGAVGNVHITGGANGQYLQTDGSGNLSFVTPPTLTFYTKNRMMSFGTSSDNETIIVTLPAEGIVDSVTVYVDTAYNGSPTLSVGIDGDVNKYTDTVNVDLKTTGRYDALSNDFPLTTTSMIKVFYNNGGSSTTGACRVLVRYSIPE
jgi:hypothetical protein